jgi:hypothetical protein
VSHPSDHPWLDYRNNISWSIQLLIMQSFRAYRYFLLLDLNFLPSCLFSNTSKLCSSISEWHQDSYPYKTTDNTIVLYIWNC